MNDGSDLLSSLINFDAQTLSLEIQSTDQTLAGEYQLRIDVTSADQRWLDQTITTFFSLTAERIQFNLTAENSSPEIIGLEEVPLFTIFKANSSWPYVIDLG